MNCVVVYDIPVVVYYISVVVYYISVVVYYISVCFDIVVDRCVGRSGPGFEGEQHILQSSTRAEQIPGKMAVRHYRTILTYTCIRS